MVAVGKLASINQDQFGQVAPLPVVLPIATVPHQAVTQLLAVNLQLSEAFDIARFEND